MVLHTYDTLVTNVRITVKIPSAVKLTYTALPQPLFRQVSMMCFVTKDMPIIGLISQGHMPQVNKNMTQIIQYFCALNEMWSYDPKLRPFMTNNLLTKVVGSSYQHFSFSAQSISQKQQVTD